MSPEQKAIYDYIADHPGSYAREVVSGLGWTDGEVRPRITVMTKRDWLRAEGSTRWHRFYAVTLPPTFEVSEAFEQAPSIWRVGARIAAEAAGIDWRA